MKVRTCKCGSTLIDQIGPDTYRCRSCDSILDKDVQSEDIKSIIGKLDALTSVMLSGGSNRTDAMDMENAYRSAMALAKQDRVYEAKAALNNISDKFAWSYKGYYGNFLLKYGDIASASYIDNTALGYLKGILASDDADDNLKTECRNYLQRIKDEEISRISEKIDLAEENITSYTNQTEEQKESHKGVVGDLKNRLDAAREKRKQATWIQKILSVITTVIIIYAVIRIGKSLFVDWTFRTLLNHLEIVKYDPSYDFITRQFARLWRVILALVRLIVSFLAIGGIVGVGFSVADMILTKIGPSTDDEDKINKEMEKEDATLERVKQKLNTEKNTLSRLQNYKKNLEDINVDNINDFMVITSNHTIMHNVGNEASLKTETVEENGKTEVDIELTDAGSNQIKIIKVVREVTGLGFKEGKELVDFAPQIIMRDVDKSDAEKIKATLEAEGAKVTLY